MSVAVSHHELRHALAAGVACVQIAVPEKVYKRATTHTHISAKHGGEFSLHPANGDSLNISKVLALASLAPVVRKDRWFETLLLEPDDIKIAGQLSDEDVLHVASWGGDPTYQWVNVAGVNWIEDQLGYRKFSALGKLLRDLSNQSHDPLKLNQLVPYEIAVQAAQAGKKEIKKRFEDLAYNTGKRIPNLSRKMAKIVEVAS